jgi:hypothetical protein
VFCYTLYRGIYTLFGGALLWPQAPSQKKKPNENWLATTTAGTPPEGGKNKRWEVKKGIPRVQFDRYFFLFRSFLLRSSDA